MKNLKAILAMVSLPIAAMSASSAQIPQRGKQPIYTITINVVDRTTKAINYQHRSSSTKIDFRGTLLMPAAHGEADVESKQGYIEIKADFQASQILAESAAMLVARGASACWSAPRKNAE